jgi:hypothetical protein
MQPPEVIQRIDSTDFLRMINAEKESQRRNFFSYSRLRMSLICVNCNLIEKKIAAYVNRWVWRWV